jgi:hypothetical protein
MTANDWQKLGFGAPPAHRVSEGSGTLVFRCWGGQSTEWGTGYFSLEKPESVLDAELRFNIVDWGNGVHFVSTFRVLPGFAYMEGPVGHGGRDLRRTGTQIYIEPPLHVKLELIKSKETLRHDVFAAPGAGNA